MNADCHWLHRKEEISHLVSKPQAGIGRQWIKEANYVGVQHPREEREWKMENPNANDYFDRPPGMGGEFEAEAPAANQLAVDSADALAQLYQLLNEYAPAWYEEQYQLKAEETLRKLGRL